MYCPPCHVPPSSQVFFSSFTCLLKRAVSTLMSALVYSAPKQFLLHPWIAGNVKTRANNCTNLFCFISKTFPSVVGISCLGKWSFQNLRNTRQTQIGIKWWRVTKRNSLPLHVHFPEDNWTPFSSQIFPRKQPHSHFRFQKNKWQNL